MERKECDGANGEDPLVGWRDGQHLVVSMMEMKEGDVVSGQDPLVGWCDQLHLGGQHD